MTALAIICGAIFVLFLVRVALRSGAAVRAMVFAYALHGLALAVYYGLFFGAPHFLSRYLAPIAPLMIVASVWMALELGRIVLPILGKGLAITYSFGGVVLAAGLVIYRLLPGVSVQGHEQVVAWVTENVPKEAWVGAVQTGTLGYWHDRTINLDGKVNPAALDARREVGHVLDYVTGSEIDYIADWAGVGDWLERPEAASGFAAAFELVLQDREARIAVLRRVELRYRGD